MGPALPAPRARPSRPLRVRGGPSSRGAAGPARRATAGPMRTGAENWTAKPCRRGWTGRSRSPIRSGQPRRRSRSAGAA